MKNIFFFNKRPNEANIWKEIWFPIDVDDTRPSHQIYGHWAPFKKTSILYLIKHSSFSSFSFWLCQYSRVWFFHHNFGIEFIWKFTLSALVMHYAFNIEDAKKKEMFVFPFCESDFYHAQPRDIVCFNSVYRASVKMKKNNENHSRDVIS